MATFLTAYGIVGAALALYVFRLASNQWRLERLLQAHEVRTAATPGSTPAWQGTGPHATRGA